MNTFQTKKTLLAALVVSAIAGATGVAHADQVTVYGFIDAGVFSTNNSGGKSLTTLGNAGGNYFPSMYGITGSEDLGAGMKVGFNLQGSLDAMTGTNSGNGLFDRYASVNISGAAGSLELGRQIDLLFMQSFVNGVMPTHANSLAVNGLLAYGGGDRATTVPATTSGINTNGTIDTSRISNAATYTTPEFSGFTGKFMYAMGGVAGSTSANALYSGVITGSISGVSLSAGYETQNSNSATATKTNNYNQAMFGAKYSMGDIDLAGQYHDYKSSDSTIDTTAFEAGAAYHVSPVLTVGLNFEHFDDKAASTKPEIISVKARYDLSKHTYLYGMIADYNKDASAKMFQGYAVTLGDANTATNFAFGIVHGF